MEVNENPTTWSENVLKATISSYPQLAEMDGKVKVMNTDNQNNAIFMINYPGIKLSILVVVKNKQIMPINCGIKDGEIVVINKDTSDFVFSDFNSSSGLSNVDSSRDNYGNDPQFMNVGVKEVSDQDGNFIGYSSSNVNGGVPGEYDEGHMLGLSGTDPSVMGYGNFLNKYASINRFEKEEIILDMLKEASLERSIAVADGIFEANGNILPIETPIMKISYKKKEDDVVGIYYKYAGKGEMEPKEKKLSEEDEDEISPQIIGSILKSKDSDEDSDGIAPIGNIKIIRITKKEPVDLQPVSNGGIEASDCDGNPISGIIKKILSVFSPEESFGVPNVSGSGIVFSKNGESCFENTERPLTCLMKSEDDNDVKIINPNEAPGKTVVIITRRFVTPPIKIAMLKDGELIGEIKEGNLKKKVKISFCERENDVVNTTSELSEIKLGKNFKIAKINKILKNSINPVKKAYYDKNVFEDEELIKEASTRVNLKIFFKKNGDGSYEISAHFADSGKVFLKNIHIRSKEAIKEQLKELGVPAGKAIEISNEADSSDSFAMTLDATSSSDRSEKISSFLNMKDEDNFIKIEDVRKIAKVASIITDSSPEDGLKLMAASVVKKEELKDRDELVEDIKNISKNIKDYGFFKKCIGSEEESKELFDASLALEKALRDLYFE